MASACLSRLSQEQTDPCRQDVRRGQPGNVWKLSAGGRRHVWPWAEAHPVRAPPECPLSLPGRLLGAVIESPWGSALKWFYFFFFYIMIFFPIIAGLQCAVNFLLYSMVTQSHIHVYILFSHINMLHHKWLHIVSSAIQQDLIAFSHFNSII